MEDKQYDHQSAKSAAGEVSSEEQTLRWVAPRQSIRVFSVADFTQSFSNPGDDGSGIFTQS